MARRGSIHTVRGLITWGLAGGVVLATTLVLWRLVLFERGSIAALPDEPEVTGPASEPQPELRARGLLLPVQGIQPAALVDTFGAARGGGLR
ncbi:MAG TPA: hypothetical protein VGQ33_21995, partial [Vicinamibacteria bacterium]|nr:hypothetical protein [Vicinamibacteria bacterium]